MLVIFELANNHMGSVELGKRIIDDFAKVSREFPQFQYGFKFQYRDLETFIHPSSDPNDKYVKRFRETDLTLSERFALKEHAKGCGFITACTPFDDKSVSNIATHDYDILKIGSPSNVDWKLLGRIAMEWHGGQVLLSVGGADDDEIECALMVLQGTRLSLLHCVSEYPTKTENLQFGQIVYLKNRYPNTQVGLSLHVPHGYNYADYAVALGATVIERHVCGDEKPNKYSVTKEEMFIELTNLENAYKAFGVPDSRIPGPRPTQFMRREIDGDMWWKPVGVLDDINDLLKKSGVVLPKGSFMELSHHYGADRFREVGAAVITCFNRDYAKKYLVMLPKQSHPSHYHAKKDETFTVMYGELSVNSGEKLKKGDTLHVPSNISHGFYTETGVVFEEISTHHHDDDSFYADTSISDNPNRKSRV